MPFLDVTDVLTDPDFATTFNVTRTTESVGENGRLGSSPALFPAIVGVVTPDKRNLVRLPDGSRQTASITIYTKFQLTSGEGCVNSSPGNVASIAADVVSWKGRNYVVAAVEDWSQYGAGFVKAAADYVDINK